MAVTRIAELIGRETGIAIGSAQMSSLRAALERAAPGRRAAEVLSELPDDRVLLQRVIDEVTVNESYFFRHLNELRAIDWRGLLETAQDGVVRVWSAASAAGEEAYTLAILAAEAFGSDPPVSILASDICGPALVHGRAARYPMRSLREVPAAVRERHFVPAGDRLEVRSGLRRLVRFRRHNLVLDSAPPLGEERFDLILCRNVLIYFDAPTAERTTAELESALRPGGQLILGAADRLCGGPARRRPQRAKPPAPPPRPRPKPRRVQEARKAVAEWSLEQSGEDAARAAHEDPLDVEAHFVQGVAELARGDAAAAVASLRRALYLDPLFGLAAFKLGRAHEALGQPDAARRAYSRALKALAPDDPRSRALAENVSLADVAQACHARISALTQS
jgi:chemotaxis protein methyltransferase CheR